MQLRQAPAWRGGEVVEDACGTASASGVKHSTVAIILDGRNLFPCSIIAIDGEYSQVIETGCPGPPPTTGFLATEAASVSTPAAICIGKPPIASILIEVAPGVLPGTSAMNDEKVVAASKSLFGA
jgi:hypothetical protein